MKEVRNPRPMASDVDAGMPVYIVLVRAQAVPLGVIASRRQLPVNTPARLVIKALWNANIVFKGESVRSDNEPLSVLNHDLGSRAMPMLIDCKDHLPLPPPQG